MRLITILALVLWTSAAMAQEGPGPDPAVMRQAQCNKQCRDLHAGAYEQARVQAAGEVEICSCVGPKGETLDVYQFMAGGLVDILAAATPTTAPKGENTIPVPSPGTEPLCPACYCGAGRNTDERGIQTGLSEISNALWVLTGFVIVGTTVEVGILLYNLGK